MRRVGLAGGNQGPEAEGFFFFLKAPPHRIVEEKGTVQEPLRLASWGPHRQSGLRLSFIHFLLLPHCCARMEKETRREEHEKNTSGNVISEI